MNAPIHEHDWSLVEEWFKQRAIGSGVFAYHHVEQIAVTKVIDELVEEAAREYGFRFGQNIAKLYGDVI